MCDNNCSSRCLITITRVWLIHRCHTAAATSWWIGILSQQTAASPCSHTFKHWAFSIVCSNIHEVYFWNDKSAVSGEFSPNGPKILLKFIFIHMQLLGKSAKRGEARCVYLFFWELGDVVHSSIRLNLGVKVVDNGPWETKTQTHQKGYRVNIFLRNPSHITESCDCNISHYKPISKAILFLGKQLFKLMVFGQIQPHCLRMLGNKAFMCCISWTQR